jgi:hypothetical protein
MKPTLSAIDGHKTIAFQKLVNAHYWCNWRIGGRPPQTPDGPPLKGFVGKEYSFLQLWFANLWKSFDHPITNEP